MKQSCIITVWQCKLHDQNYVQVTLELEQPKFLSKRKTNDVFYYMDRVKRIWYLSPMRAAKVQASLRIRAVSPEPSLLAHTGSESRGTFTHKARSLAPLNGWACAVKICHDGMLEDTISLDGAHIISLPYISSFICLARILLKLSQDLDFFLTNGRRPNLLSPSVGYLNQHVIYAAEAVC